MEVVKISVLSVLATFWAGSAYCQKVEASKPATVLSAIQELGFQATLTKDSSGDPLVESSSDGSKFNIFFDDCSNHVCNIIYFGKNYTMEKNDYSLLRPVSDDWNSKSYFTKSTIDDESISISYYIDLSQGGIEKELFESNFNRWIKERLFFRNNIVAAFATRKK